MEVKSSLSVADVKKFISDLQRGFNEFFPEYAEKQLYGAVAGIGIESESGCVRQSPRGCLCWLNRENGVVILNDASFQPPRAW